MVSAERIGFTNTASHAQLTRVFQDAIVAFSNERTLNEIIKRVSDGKSRVAKMMRRDLELTELILLKKRKSRVRKNLILFNRFPRCVIIALALFIVSRILNVTS